MNLYNKKFTWKLILIVSALIIGFLSLYYTQFLVKKLAFEEEKKAELWAEATRLLGSPDISNNDIGFLLEVIQNNRTVPVILTDSSDNIVASRNFDSIKAADTAYLKSELLKMKEKNKRITIEVGNNNVNYIYYKESNLLIQLKYYPYIQLTVILLFVIVAYLAFSSSRKAEQNQVWIGLTKETAHQLGTPTSSLMAWKELLKEKNVDENLLLHLENDINRLSIITDRFSKIGSKPALKLEPLVDVIADSLEYLRKRTASNIDYILNHEKVDLYVPLSRSLFEWVIENICKNAIDAIDGKSGLIKIDIKKFKKKIIIDITDNGKGIPKSKFKTIFKPGFTTKTRGWGLGLSLAKRIIENFHNGKIYVYSSELGKGTTIRIEMKS